MKKSKKSIQDQRDAFPAMRFDMNRRLIDSNVTALPILCSWNCRKGTKLTQDVLRNLPDLQNAFKVNTPTECKIIFSGLEIWFDVVPFPEAGYVGFYGYHIESVVPEKVYQKSGMTY